MVRQQQCGTKWSREKTFINLLSKFYKPDDGIIYLDGIDLEEYENGSLRNNIGLVLQNNHIFEGTIFDNISYGKRMLQLRRLLKLPKAYLHDQVLSLPDEYYTNASNLSGGQQQRIAIARLFLKDPPIIFLDEPTEFRCHCY